MAEDGYQPRNPAVTSRIMSAVRGKDNKAEMALRKKLWHRGLRYRLYDSALPGSPDLTFRGQRVAVFVDGDFWHGRILLEEGEEALRLSFRPARRDFWVEKITRNVDRDRNVRQELREEGWTVVQVWESDILADLEATANRVETAIRGSG